MRKYSVALLGLLLLIVFSCKKEELRTDFDTLTQGAYLTLTKVNNTNIDYSALNTSTVSIQVGGKGSPIDKVNIYVTTEPTIDKTKWKLIKAVPFSEGLNLEVKATEIAAALGIPPSSLSPGNQYTLYNEVVTKDGRTFSSVNTDADFEGQAGYNMALHWTATVICPYNSAAFSSGTFVIVTDEWGDYNAGDVVGVAVGPGANQLTLTVYPKPGAGTNQKSFPVNITPANGVATVPNTVYGDYPGFPNLAVKTAGSSNYVFACINTIKLLLNHTSPAGDFGNYLLVIKKQ
jgi:hypothetical protein